jgi:hypothetical protein
MVITMCIMNCGELIYHGLSFTNVLTKVLIQDGYFEDFETIQLELSPLYASHVVHIVLLIVVTTKHPFHSIKQGNSKPESLPPLL